MLGETRASGKNRQHRIGIIVVEQNHIARLGGIGEMRRQQVPTRLGLVIVVRHQIDHASGPALQAKYRGTSTGTNRERRNKPSGSTIAAQPRTANTAVSRRSRQAPSAAKVTLTTASPGTLDGSSPKVMKLEIRSRYTGATIAQIVLDVSGGAQPAPSRTAPLPAAKTQARE